MIDDFELRMLFKTEFEEHLQRMDDALLRIEQRHDDFDSFLLVSREAHSMKGGARMLGLETLVRLAHLFEDVFGRMQRDRTTLTDDAFTVMYEALVAMRALVDEAVSGNPAAFDFDSMTRRIDAIFAPLLAATAAPTAVPGIPVPPAPAAAETAAESRADSPRDATARPDDETAARVRREHDRRFSIDTIRVPPQKLDVLMSLAGELTVVRGHSTRHLTSLEDIAAGIDELARVSTLGQGAGSAPGVDDAQLERIEHLSMLLDRFRGAFSEDRARIDYVAQELADVARKLRMLPLSTIFGLYPRMVRELATAQGKEVVLVIEGGTTTADKKIIEEMKDPLMHIIRNSVDHGIEMPRDRQAAGKPPRGTVTIRASQASDSIIIEVEDDGRGLDVDRIRRTALERGLATDAELDAGTLDDIHAMIFAPGFSTAEVITDISGRGVGMNVVQVGIEKLKGRISIDSAPGRGCRIRITLPITLATLHVMIARSGSQLFALPIDTIHRTFLITNNDIFLMDGRETVVHNDEPVSVVPLWALLDMPEPDPHPTALRTGGGSTAHQRHCIVVAIEGQHLGVIVDEAVDEQEVVMKPFGPILGEVRNVASSTILASGEVCMILNPADFLATMRQTSAATPAAAGDDAEPRKRTILLVEDSITTRTQEKRILESAGFEVIVAVDGLDGLQKLQRHEIHVVISDVQMPNMDGLELTTVIRKDPKYRDLPIVLVTSLATDADRRRGLEAGADAYITKAAFDQKGLIDTIQRLL